MVAHMLHYSLAVPRILLANCISLGIIVTRLPWIAQRFESSNKPTKWASAASCNANIADACQRYATLVIVSWSSRTNRANGNRRSRRSVDCWYLLISLRAFSPIQIMSFPYQNDHNEFISKYGRDTTIDPSTEDLSQFEHSPGRNRFCLVRVAPPRLFWLVAVRTVAGSWPRPPLVFGLAIFPS